MLECQSIEDGSQVKCLIFVYNLTGRTKFWKGLKFTYH